MNKSYIKNIKATIILMTLESILFVFLSYLLNGKIVNKIVIFIIVFNIISFIYLIFFEMSRQKSLKSAIVNFVNRPDYQSMDKLSKLMGDDYGFFLEELLDEKKSMDLKLEGQRQELLEYRDLVELWTHEIKTPISIIDLTLQNHQSDMDQTVFEKFSYANIQIKNYVDNILYFARSTTDKKDYKMEKILINDVVSEALSKFHSIIAEEGIIINENIEEIVVLSDFNTLVFIISQIISNAIKYTENLIKIEATSKNPNSLFISNNGSKIYEKDLPFIFEKGFTGSTSKNMNSTGMGLYLSKLHADNLGIDLIIHNEGELFAIELAFKL